MRCEADINALRAYLRCMYRTEPYTCCQSLLAMSYVVFEQRCRTAMRHEDDNDSFGAFVCQGMKLEYNAQEVAVLRNMTSAPTTGAGVVRKRSLAYSDDVEEGPVLKRGGAAERQVGVSSYL